MSNIMKVCIHLRNGLSYVTGLGYMKDIQVYLVFGELLMNQDFDQNSIVNLGMSILLRPQEVVFQNQEGKELMRDISDLQETWAIPLTNIDYITTKEVSFQERTIKGLKWKIAFVEKMPDEDEGRGLAITGKQQQLLIEVSLTSASTGRRGPCRP